MPSVGNQKRVFFKDPWTGCLDKEQFSLSPNVRESGFRNGGNFSCGKQRGFLALESAMELKES